MHSIVFYTMMLDKPKDPFNILTKGTWNYDLENVQGLTVSNSSQCNAISIFLCILGSHNFLSCVSVCIILYCNNYEFNTKDWNSSKWRYTVVASVGGICIMPEWNVPAASHHRPPGEHRSPLRGKGRLSVLAQTAWPPRPLSARPTGHLQRTDTLVQPVAGSHGR